VTAAEVKVQDVRGAVVGTEERMRGDGEASEVVEEEVANPFD